MQRAVETLAKKYRIATVILFGSQATGKVHSQSDTDIAVVFLKKPTLNQELKLRQEFAKIFKTEIDLVDLEHAAPLILKEITTNGKVLHGSMSQFQDLQFRAFQRFEDYKYYIELQNKFNRNILLNAK